MNKIVSFLLAFLFISSTAQAQDHLERWESIDVLHYGFNIDISDENDEIGAIATIDIAYLKDLDGFDLDLTGVDAEGKGMTVASVTTLDGFALPFSHDDDQLSISLKGIAGDMATVVIEYSGIPANGLIISRNMFDDRTFFADNWPNRAHYWLPTVDHPSDKATVDWAITAPVKYQVVANGWLAEETDLDGGMRLTRWVNEVPIPTKVMVFGAARFAVDQVAQIYGVPVSSWVYPQNRNEGFYDYEMAVGILDWFINHVGPYPYAKLANVQSKTMFGGMENAGAIFYSERSVSGERRIEGLLAHEIAHQWFGNSASEASWHHSWLSEGFATYFTNLYTEHRHGRDAFVESLKGQRQSVISFAERSYVPLVNTAITDYMQVLSTNTYQKGGWVLHMLRREVGDDLFWEAIRTYYNRFRNGNAYSDDLKVVFEEVSGRSFETFFQQWVYTAGHPDLDVRWSVSGATLTLDITQKQESLFSFPLDIEIEGQDGTSQRETIQVSERTTSFEIEVDNGADAVVLDPATWLLFVADVNRK